MEKLVDNLLKEDSESSTYVLPKLRFRMLMEYLPRFISDEIRIFYKYLSYMSEFKKRYKIRNLITNAILDEGYFGIRGLKIIKGVFRRKANNHFFGKSDIRDEINGQLLTHPRMITCAIKDYEQLAVKEVPGWLLSFSHCKMFFFFV